MAQFDPYRKWLGIPPKEQPPHHYRLLGIGLFESDADVIANAADRQMAHVRQYQSGRHSDLSQRLLNELAAARVCLLDPARKSGYDDELRRALTGQAVATLPPPPPPGAAASALPPPPPGSPPLPPPPLAPPGPAAPMPPIAPPAYGGYPGRKRRNSPIIPLVLVIAGLAVVGIIASTLMNMGSEASSKPTSHGNGNRPEAVLPAKRPADDPTRPPKVVRKERDKEKEPAPAEPQTGKVKPWRPKRGSWSLPDGEGVIRSLVGHRGASTSAVLFAEGDFAVSGGDDGTVRLWDLQASSDLRHFEGGVHGVLNVALNVDAERVLACSGKSNPAAAGMLHVWNAAGGSPSQVDLSKPGVAWDARFSPDGKWIAVACNDHTIRLLNATTLQETRVLAGHTAAVRAVAFFEQGDRLASASDDQSVRLWSTTEDAPPQVLSGHTGAVVSVAYSPDGKYVASGSADRTVRLWKVETGQSAQPWTHPAAVTSVAFAPDGLGVLSGCADGSIRLWRMADGAEAWKYEAHTGGVRSVAYLPQSARKAITAGADGVVRVWGLPDLRAGKVGAGTPAATPRIVRVAPPDAAAIAQATKRVKDETFKAEFAAADKPAAKLTLAQKLLQEGSKDEFAPADRFVALGFARDLATEANDFDTALGAIEQLDQRFEVLGADMKAAAIESLSGNLTQTPKRKALAVKSLQAAADAVTVDRYDAAERLAIAARGLAQKANDGALYKQAEARLTEIDGLKQKYQAVQGALGTLAANPKDPAANLSAGDYYCFVKADWTKGLAHWAAASDEALRKQAQLDLSNPVPPAERAAVGDGWWDLAEKQSGANREALRRRAVFWYRPLEATLTGLDQTRVKMRLAEFDGAPAPGEGGSTTPAKGREAARLALLRSQGGTDASEAAVAKALEWLARHQNADGSWNFNHVRAECKDQCPDAGTLDAPQTATSLALLAFLGAGHSHRAESKSKHQRVIAAGLDFLRISATRGIPDKNNQHIPPQALATMVICEASEGGLDRTSRGQAVIAAKFLIDAQNVDGGWGFQPRTPKAAGDASDAAATAWHVYALKAAQWAGAANPSSSLKRAGSYLDVAPKTDPFTTAQRMLSHIHAGWPRDKQELVDYVGQLAKAGPSSNGRFYLNFLQNQVMREAGGAAWPAWNTALRDHLVNTQATTGHAAGSWTSTQGDWGNSAGGRLFCTAMGALTLEVYYRTPPVYPAQ